MTRENTEPTFYALCPEGKVLWTFLKGYGVVSSPTVGLDGTVCIGSFTGDLYALRGISKGLANSLYPMFRCDIQPTRRIARR
jgi:hypothetical protein